MQSDLYFDFFHEIRESNLKRVEDSLLRALETVHLLDEEIKMRVRFGHVCFTRIPLTKDFNNDATLTINELNEKVLKKTRTESKFATRIATEESQLIGLIEVLSGNDLGCFGSPNREFKIHATRKTNDKEWPCAFDLELRNGNESKHKKYDGKIGLWSAIIHDRNVLDINMSCLANEYSWKLQIKTAKRLFNTPPQENFINGLEVCPQGRLIYSNTKDINVVSVYEKTKWKYQWNSDYIVEIVKYEFWEKLSKYHDIQGLPVYLREEPFVVSYGVNFYKKSWDNNFANNLDLDVGEAPEWHPQDIMDDLTEEGKTEGVDGLMNDIKTFLDVLESKIPTPAEHELCDT
ncbi:hypothetical protein RhiirC2_524255 [Rhizophagus irregularis]|uniref:DUF7905 domain-containing protein n=1 Tax=Rhizophagus irregularis TaxID=588596 RepID=A0A2N1N4M5_9GLOM|nr:hypothetical protein RhiirC2_524255 [Rhizophagus irregularis]